MTSEPSNMEVITTPSDLNQQMSTLSRNAGNMFSVWSKMRKTDHSV